MTNRRPDYRLVIAAKDKDSNGKAKTDAGVAWRNDHGGINISLNPGVVLDHALTKEFYVTLWEAQYDNSYAGSGTARQSTHSRGLRPPPTPPPSTGAKTYPPDVEERGDSLGPGWHDFDDDIPF